MQTDDHLLGAVLLGDLDAAVRATSGPSPSTARLRMPGASGSLGQRGEEALGLLGRRHGDRPALAQQREGHAPAGGDPPRGRLVLGARSPTPRPRCGAACRRVRARRSVRGRVRAASAPLGVDEVRERVREARARRPTARSASRSRAARPRAAPGARAASRPDARTGGPAGRRPSRWPSSSASCCGKSSGAAWRRSRCRANVVIGSVPAARPMPRSMRPGYSPASRLNVSATLKGL